MGRRCGVGTGERTGQEDAEVWGMGPRGAGTAARRVQLFASHVVTVS